MKQGRAHPNYGRLDRREAARLRREERLTNVEIAARLGMSEGAIWRALGPMPDEMRKLRRWEDGHIRTRVETLRWDGLTIRQITAETGVPATTVWKWTASRG